MILNWEAVEEFMKNFKLGRCQANEMYQKGLIFHNVSVRQTTYDLWSLKFPEDNFVPQNHCIHPYKKRVLAKYSL